MNFYSLYITCLLMCTNTYLLLLILINYNHVTLLSILILYLVSFLVCVNIKFIIQVYWLCKDNNPLVKKLHPPNCYSIISLDWIWAKRISLLWVLSSVEMISNRCYFWYTTFILFFKKQPVNKNRETFMCSYSFIRFIKQILNK